MPLQIQACPLPNDALLNAYTNNGGYTDCFFADIEREVSHEQFIRAFYTSLPFKLERAFLSVVILKPSSDAQAAQLAAGSLDKFSAWTVEKRATNQLLLCDYQKKTRSWLMVMPCTVGDVVGTRLYFGSAVTPTARATNGQRKLSVFFRALLGCHKVYSVVLLRAAAKRCLRLK